MKTTKYHSCPFLCFATALPLLLAGPAAGQEAGTSGVFIQGGHSGTWYDVTQPGHGLFVEVLDDTTSPTGKEVLASWFGYFDGMQIWLLGQGDVVDVNGEYTAILDVSIFDGNDFPPRYERDQTVATRWGEIRLQFQGCDQATLRWESVLQGYGTGELALRRLTRIADSACLPDLGGQAPSDDHGDTWATGTYLTGISGSTRVLEGKLEHEGDVDVFVVTLSEPRAFTAYTLGPGELDTVGALFELVNYEEEFLVEEDEGSHFGGFMIVESLPAGTYTLHVRGKDDRVTGPYKLFYKAVND
jgi:hypothetical protein